MKKSLILVALAVTFSLTVNAQYSKNYASIGHDVSSKIESFTGAAMPEDIGSGNITRMLTVGTTLYVAGRFEKMDRRVVNNIAKWDGTKWSGLGKGVDGPVYDMCMVGSDLYVSGDFSVVDGGAVEAPSIARWDGTKWNALTKPTVDRSARALAAMGNDLIVAGNFTKVGGTLDVKGIAKWDGKAWSNIGGAIFDKTVLALTVMGTEIYAGGFFTLVGEEPANSIAKFDGTKWSEVGSGGIAGTINVLANDGKNVYAGGTFDGKIKKFDGSAWANLGDGVSGEVKGITIVGTDIYVAGGFDALKGGGAAAGAGDDKKKGKDKKAAKPAKAGKDIETQFVGKWNGTAWTGFPKLHIYAATANAVAVYNGAMILGGDFNDAFQSAPTAVPARGVLKLEGAAWGIMK